MNSVVAKAIGMAKQLGFLALEYFHVAVQWVLKFFKIQIQKWKKCGAQKKLESAYGSLGGEIYALDRQGETDWKKMPSVQQFLRDAEEAESRLIQLDQDVDDINSGFLTKRQEIKEKYSTRRAEMSEAQNEEQS